MSFLLPLLILNSSSSEVFSVGIPTNLPSTLKKNEVFQFVKKVGENSGFNEFWMPIIKAMTKTVSKIKEVIKINKPIFNEKYKVWVVRMKLKSGWKAIWRKDKNQSQKIYDHLITKIVKVEEPKVEKSSTPTKTEVSSKEKKSSVFDSIDLKKDDPIQTKVIVNKETNKVPIKEVKK